MLDKNIHSLFVVYRVLYTSIYIKLFILLKYLKYVLLRNSFSCESILSFSLTERFSLLILSQPVTDNFGI